MDEARIQEIVDRVMARVGELPETPLEAVRTPQVETPEHKQLHEDLLREGPRDAGAAEGIGEEGIDITESDGPYLEGGDDVS